MLQQYRQKMSNKLHKVDIDDTNNSTFTSLSALMCKQNDFPFFLFH